MSTGVFKGFFFIHDIVVKAPEKNRLNQKVHKAIVSLSRDGSRAVAHIAVEFTETDADNGRLQDGEFGTILNNMLPNNVGTLRYP